MTVLEAFEQLRILINRGYEDHDLETTCPKTGLSYGVTISDAPDSDDRAIPVILEQ